MFKVNKTQHVLAVNDFDEAVSYFTDKLGNARSTWLFFKATKTVFYSL